MQLDVIFHTFAVVQMMVGRQWANDGQKPSQEEHARLFVPNAMRAREEAINYDDNDDDDDDNNDDQQTTQSNPSRSAIFKWWIKVLAWCILLIISCIALIKWGIPFAFEKVRLP